MNESDNSEELSAVARPKRSSTTRDGAFWSSRQKISWVPVILRSETRDLPLYYRVSLSKSSIFPLLEHFLLKIDFKRLYLELWSSVLDERRWKPLQHCPIRSFLAIREWLSNSVFFRWLYRESFKIHFCTLTPGRSSYVSPFISIFSWFQSHFRSFEPAYTRQ